MVGKHSGPEEGVQGDQIVGNRLIHAIILKYY